MDSRKQFEEWAKTGSNPLEEEDFRWMDGADNYYFSVVRYMWEAWQASRESVTLIIHRRRGIYPDADDYEAAIEVAGLRTKFADESK